MSGKSIRGALLLPRRRRRALALPVLALLVVAVAATTSWAGGAVAWPTAAQETANSGVFTNLPFCGTKPITLGIHDGYGINAWSAESYAAVRSEAAKCKNVKQIAVAGGGDLQKSISDINSMVAQGAKAIVLVPDFGQAQLASIQAATAAGVKVVPWGADPGGTPGKDYVTYVDWSSPIAGTMWANWMVTLFDGKGNIVFLGGPAGNPVTTGQLHSIVKVFAKHPGMKLLTGKTSWPVTNWNPATAQKQMSALLAKFPKIDGIISDYGTDALAATRAIKAANRKLPAIATLDANGLSCLYNKVHKSNPQFQLATISSRNWLGRIAARKAIAAAEGLPNKEPSLIDLPFYENSVSGQAPLCTPGASPDFYSSNKLTVGTISKFGKPS
jgi:ribose transport system substrate-binding protein